MCGILPINAIMAVLLTILFLFRDKFDGHFGIGGGAGGGDLVFGRVSVVAGDGRVCQCVEDSQAVYSRFIGGLDLEFSDFASLVLQDSVKDSYFQVRVPFGVGADIYDGCSFAIVV